jgi:hypothetical protein
MGVRGEGDQIAKLLVAPALGVVTVQTDSLNSAARRSVWRCS